jgi:hypothetical protein
MRVIGICAAIFLVAFLVAMVAADRDAEIPPRAASELIQAHPRMFRSMPWQEAASLRRPQETIFMGNDGEPDVRQAFDHAAVATRVRAGHMDRGFYFVYQPAPELEPQYVHFSGNGCLAGFALAIDPP